MFVGQGLRRVLKVCCREWLGLHGIRFDRFEDFKTLAPVSSGGPSPFTLQESRNCSAGVKRA